MSIHVEAGKKAEEQFVIELNGDKKDPRWQTLGIKNPEEYFAIRVTKKVPSKKLGHLANAKADVYIASGKLEQSLLEDKKFFLTDDDVEDIGLSRKEGTGISVKRTDSKNIRFINGGLIRSKKFLEATSLALVSPFTVIDPRSLLKTTRCSVDGRPAGKNLKIIFQI